MTMEGGGPPVDWAALAPHIEHPTREFIVEALRCIGPLSAPDLRRLLDDPQLHPASVVYHLTTLISAEVLTKIGQRPAGASIEPVYFLTSPK
jgi:hypothetical protein